jgi:hypothetical protein
MAVRRFLIGFMVVCAGFFAFAGVAGATSQDGTWGSAKYDCPSAPAPGPGCQNTPFGSYPAHIHVNASTFTPGAALGAHGTFWAVTDATSGGFGVVVTRGRVTCLDASGNVSVSRGVITQSNFPLFSLVGVGVLSTNIDNGQGAGALPDEVGSTLFVNPFSACSVAQAGPTDAIVSGNITVHDGV